MTDKKKLEFAHKNYPKGTKVSWPSEITKIEFKVSGSYRIPEGTLAVMDSECDYHSIFNGKNWAKIVK